MPRPRTKTRPAENLDYARAFQAWMDSHNFDAASLAQKLNVSPRSVDRWRSGESVPDARVRGILGALGAPPMDRAKKGPAASKRIEAMLAEIIERLERIEKRLA